MDQPRHDLAGLRRRPRSVECRVVFPGQILADKIGADLLTADPAAQMRDVEPRLRLAGHDARLPAAGASGAACSPITGTRP